MEEEDIYYLSPDELEAVKEGIWQIENGLFISHEEANRRIALILNNHYLNFSKPANED